ncbi:TldD/PmbA family protein [Geitlerinema sp. P-1104]|uniref:TldD/PmbA family protein n=1 Tax=Geitlerinema sp. P-1104 TaxID=2546230 RepID=UPI001476C21E|nr:TldD/PmbA family protein [Geitlerinema sp. P-1104]NMG59447.1 TldD/PmbA family protein [Geitlerinema sp. P-1104]
MIEQLLDLALNQGADAAEVFQSRSHARPVYFEANRLKQLESVESEGTSLRIWRNGQPGLAVAYGEISPEDLVRRALSISHLNPPEPLDLQTPYPSSNLDVGQAVSVEQLLSWGRESIEQIRERYPETLCTAAWECDHEQIHLANTAGLNCHYTDITLSSDLAVEWVRGDDFLSVSDGESQRDRLYPSHITEPILERLAWAKENVPCPSGRFPVLFTAKAADLLWGTIQGALNGKQAMEQSSPWSSKLHQQVLSPQITLSQQPHLGPYSCPFDDEGTPTRALTFIDEGVLQLFYCDRRIGRLLGSGSTGNGFRPGLSSYPTPGLFNLRVEPGSDSLQALIAQLDHGLIVDEILGGGGGLSGDFSVNVALGYRVEKGQVLGRVKDTMVSGNVYTALREVIRLGGDARWNGSCYTPSILVDGLSVTGQA